MLHVTPDDLRDADLDEEIALVGALVVAASSSAGQLSQAQIDEILGVPDPGRRPAAP